MTDARHPLILFIGLLSLASGCEDRAPVDGTIPGAHDSCRRMPLQEEREVDILFVIDNSNSMEHEQRSNRNAFPKHVDALRSDRLNGMIPNVHIGITSTDLGAGNYNLPSCEAVGGDRGKLLNKPRYAGCIPPSDPWISYEDGLTNIPFATTGNPISAVKAAFQCISEIGVGGCGFEQTMAASWKALDPKINMNPGFLREHALLAVVYITDEDDCSANNSGLFDPSKQGLTDPLGPLTSFRCFEFGIKCDCPGKSKCDRTTTGPRKNCVPIGTYLYKTETFIDFFKKLKKTVDGKPKPDGVVMAAVAGPTDRVEVGLDGNNPTLKPSCQTAQGFAVPGIRLKAVVHAFARELSAAQIAQIKAKKTFTPYWVDSEGKWREENFSTICSSDFSPAMRRLGQSITAALGTTCLEAPALTAGKRLVCRKGDVIGTGSAGKQITCRQSCLEDAALSVTLVTGSLRRTVPRCSAKLFEPYVAPASCGVECPCWRIVPRKFCWSIPGSSPYSLEVMGAAAARGYLQVCGATSEHHWGSRQVADLPQCD